MLVDEEDEELLVGWEDEEGVLDAELVVRALDLAPHAANRNAEDALAPLEQIDDFVR